MMLSEKEKVTDISQKTDIPTKRLRQWKRMIGEYQEDMSKEDDLLAFFKEKEAEIYIGATFTNVSEDVVEIGAQEEADIEMLRQEVHPSDQAPLLMTAQINNQTQESEVEDKEVVLAVDQKDPIKPLPEEAEQPAQGSNQTHTLASAPEPEMQVKEDSKS